MGCTLRSAAHRGDTFLARPLIWHGYVNARTDRSLRCRWTDQKCAFPREEVDGTSRGASRLCPRGRESKQNRHRVTERERRWTRTYYRQFRRLCRVIELIPLSRDGKPSPWTCEFLPVSFRQEDTARRVGERARVRDSRRPWTPGKKNGIKKNARRSVNGRFDVTLVVTTLTGAVSRYPSSPGAVWQRDTPDVVAAIVIIAGGIREITRARESGVIITIRHSRQANCGRTVTRGRVASSLSAWRRAGGQLHRGTRSEGSNVYSSTLDQPAGDRRISRR